jgi:GNAT superfamily N-acetyltransferase
MVPDEFLDGLTVEGDIASGFGSGLEERRAGAEQFVALTSAAGIAAYALACSNQEPAPDFTGELEATYVLHPHLGRGVGTLLVREVARYRVSTGRTSMIVCLLEQNPYRRFYELLGGTLAGRRVGEPHRLGGRPLPEVAYGWKDIRRLANS